MQSRFHSAQIQDLESDGKRRSPSSANFQKRQLKTTEANNVGKQTQTKNQNTSSNEQISTFSPTHPSDLPVDVQVKVEKSIEANMLISNNALGIQMINHNHLYF